MLDAIAVVHVNVDVENARVMEEQLKYCKNDIINIAKPRSFRLLGMMQAAGPVDGDIRLVVRELAGCVKRASCVKRAVIVKAIKYRAIVTSIVSICLAFGIPCVV